MQILTFNTHQLCQGSPLATFSSELAKWKQLCWYIPKHKGHHVYTNCVSSRIYTMHLILAATSIKKKHNKSQLWSTQSTHLNMRGNDLHISALHGTATSKDMQSSTSRLATVDSSSGSLSPVCVLRARTDGTVKSAVGRGPAVTPKLYTGDVNGS